MKREKEGPMRKADDVSPLRSSLWFSLSTRSTNHRLNPQLSTWEITPPHEHSRRGKEQQAASNKQEQNNSKPDESLERIASGAETNTDTLLMKSSMTIVLLKLLTENSNSC